jgi:hypothetical protein
MNRIKDFLYDKNDVLVALIILSLAAIVILARVDAIMAYPERMTLASLPENNQTFPPQERPNVPANGETLPYENGEENGENGENGHNGENEYNGEDPYPEPNGDGDPNDTEPVTGNFALYIASGQSMSVVGRNLVSLGLFESEQQFSAALVAHNAAHRVRAGNFIIPRGSSHEDVIRIITSNPTGP